MDVDFAALLSSGFIPGWLIVSAITIRWLRERAANKQADNEARRIEVEADGSLRTDLLARIRHLEESQQTALANERKRCDEELDAIRRRLSAAEEECRGLQRQIIQNSQSTAQMLGDPAGAAIAKAARRRREEGQ